MTFEHDDPNLKRLYMRSIRRGTKEMDLVLGGFAAKALPNMSADILVAYENLLGENDHDIYAWILGQMTPPQELAGIIQTIQGDVNTKNFSQI
ncbi:MAG: FAD assembly factor SdhE [Planktomarina sp.]